MIAGGLATIAVAITVVIIAVVIYYLKMRGRKKVEPQNYYGQPVGDGD